MDIKHTDRHIGEHIVYRFYAQKREKERKLDTSTFTSVDTKSSFVDKETREVRTLAYIPPCLSLCIKKFLA